MAIKSFQFASVGKTHQEQNDFFKFLVNEHFRLHGSRVIQWCRFESLKIIVEALEPEIVEWAEKTIGNTIETNTGYKYILV